MIQSQIHPKKEADFDTFNNLECAFEDKTDRQLQKTYLLLRLIQSPVLAKAMTQATLLALNIRLPVIPFIRHSVFELFCGGESIGDCEKKIAALNKKQIGTVLDHAAESKVCEKDFNNTAQEITRILQLAKGKKNHPYTSIKMTGIGRTDLLKKISARKPLTEKETVEFSALKERFAAICHIAFQNKVLLNIDAEESWIQQAIDDLSLEMMKRYNRNEVIISFTLQMYRTDRLQLLEELLNLAEKENLHVGIKLVRGAYWEKENKNARTNGMLSPVYQTKAETDQAFNLAIKKCLAHLERVVLCLATHNEESTLYLMQQMSQLLIPNDHPHLLFSQLYGMGDHLTGNLARRGYNTSKYLPYGPIRNVIPYLIRRIEENTAIQGQMGREINLVRSELRRRKE